MEPIKPIEGVLKDSEGQASSLAGTIRDSYWKQRARKQQVTTPVDATEENSELIEKRQNKSNEGSSVQRRDTYAEFEVNKDNGEVLVRIIDANSGKLVRTIPSDELAKEIAKGNLHPNQLRRRSIRL